MRHTMRLTAEPFEKIRSGLKSIESRLYDDKRKDISVGDTITFHLDTDEHVSVTKTVAALHLYASFADMMTDLPATRFGWEHAEDATTEISRFYSDADQARFGVVGIALR